MLIRTLLACVVVWIWSDSIHAEKPDDKPKIKVEFRRAETKPANGLTAAMVEGSKEKIYLHNKAELTAEDIAEAKASLDNAQKLAIDITFTKAGGMKMAKLSEDHLGKPLAVIVDGKVLSAPTIRVIITEKATITGSFTQEEMEKIVVAINAK
jgi:preprotein translocase subunit SecD